MSGKVHCGGHELLGPLDAGRDPREMGLSDWRVEEL